MEPGMPRHQLRKPVTQPVNALDGRGAQDAGHNEDPVRLPPSANRSSSCSPILQLFLDRRDDLPELKGLRESASRPNASGQGKNALEPLLLRHQDVCDHEVERLLAIVAQAHGAVARLNDFVTCELEASSQEYQNLRLIVDDENPAHRTAPFTTRTGDRRDALDRFPPKPPHGLELRGLT